MNEKFYDKSPNGQNFNNMNDDSIRRSSMDDRGRIRNNGSSGVISHNTRTFLILGWISAALSLFVSPYFAVAGITFGILTNRQYKGSGNIIIIVNIVLAAINFLFRVFLVAIWRMMIGF